MPQLPDTKTKVMMSACFILEAPGFFLCLNLLTGSCIFKETEPKGDLGPNGFPNDIKLSL